MNGVTEDYLVSVAGIISSSSIVALRALMGDALSGRLTPDELMLGISRHSPAPVTLVIAVPAVSGVSDTARELEMVHRWASSPASLSRRAMLSAAGGDS